MSSLKVLVYLLFVQDVNGMKKEFSYPQLTRILTLILVLLSLFLGSPYLHNHPHNIFESDDCPAFLIQILLLSSSITLVILLNLLFIPDSEFFEKQKIPTILGFTLQYIFNRAPPSVYRTL
jgi:hypothetical protein